MNKDFHFPGEDADSLRGGPRLLAFILGELNPVDRAQVEQALQHNPTLGVEAERLENALAALRHTMGFPSIEREDRPPRLGSIRRLHLITELRRATPSITFFKSIENLLIHLGIALAIGLLISSSVAVCNAIGLDSQRDGFHRQICCPAQTHGPNSNYWARSDRSRGHSGHATGPPAPLRSG